MVPEARLEQREAGLEAVTEGWFVLNVRDGPWVTSEDLTDAAIFEGGDYEFPQVGFTLGVLKPGKPSGLYHREANQENFLVLSGECLLIIEGEERPLKAWDFVHCPPETNHVLVGAGDGPCLVFMTGARETWPEKGIVFPRSEVALRHNAGVEEETTLPAEAYASYRRWAPGRPKDWSRLPF
jgi:uncharacterized cupin superfamily protein